MSDYKSCYCDQTEHEMCWDGIIGIYDSDCSCCINTIAEIEEN